MPLAKNGNVLFGMMARIIKWWVLRKGSGSWRAALNVFSLSGTVVFICTCVFNVKFVALVDESGHRPRTPSDYAKSEKKKREDTETPKWTTTPRSELNFGNKAETTEHKSQYRRQ